MLLRMLLLWKSGHDSRSFSKFTTQAWFLSAFISENQWQEIRVLVLAQF